MPKDLMEYGGERGKFEAQPKLTRVLWEKSLSGEFDADQEVGSSDEGGFYQLFLRLSESDFDGANIGTTRAAILQEDSQGFVTGLFFDDNKAAESRWAKIEAEFVGDDDEEDDDDDAA